jgi:hypothetical protein
VYHKTWVSLTGQQRYLSVKNLYRKFQRSLHLIWLVSNGCLFFPDLKFPAVATILKSLPAFNVHRCYLEFICCSELCFTWYVCLIFLGQWNQGCYNGLDDLYSGYVLVSFQLQRIYSFNGHGLFQDDYLRFVTMTDLLHHDYVGALPIVWEIHLIYRASAWNLVYITLPWKADDSQPNYGATSLKVPTSSSFAWRKLLGGWYEMHSNFSWGNV